MDYFEQTIISIATGIRGLESGLENIGITLRVAAYVEIEAFIIENLVQAMEIGELDQAPVWTDIKTFPGYHFHNKIHGIIAGYPCQPFSNSGKRKGNEDPRHIFPYILKSIKDTNPLWCFFENVEGHLSMGFEEVYRSLHDLGYKVEAGLFSANEVGAPHVRKRLYILAVKMEYSNVAEIKRFLFADEKKFSIIRNSDKMADSNIISGGKFAKIQNKTKKTKTQAWRQDREWSRSKFISGYSDVSHSGSIRIRESVPVKQTGLFDINVNEWPAPPGASPYYWEQPRAIKSGMGCTVDGYNFRIDLLRALGNGVVSKTAAKAFINLINKF